MWFPFLLSPKFAAISSLNSEEARAEAEGNEKSLYHIIKPEIDFPVGTDEHDEQVYAKAAENFQLFQDKGWLVQDKKENYYIYAQTMNGKTQYGLVVGAYVPDYMNGIIKKHELTRRDKEEDRMKHEMCIRDSVDSTYRYSAVQTERSGSWIYGCNAGYRFFLYLYPETGWQGYDERSLRRLPSDFGF